MEPRYLSEKEFEEADKFRKKLIGIMHDSNLNIHLLLDLLVFEIKMLAVIHSKTYQLMFEDLHNAIDNGLKELWDDWQKRKEIGDTDG